ncbi:MAG: hypothetical protein AB2421_13790 [Thermotaleaceae bacterium]
MKISGIKDITYEGNSVDINLGVIFDEETMVRWNLIEPIIQVVYNTDGQIAWDYMELIDQGMIVHAFEFDEKERKQIEKYLRERHITEKIEKKL